MSLVSLRVCGYRQTEQPPIAKRIHDNALVTTAHDDSSTHVLPVYVFDERFLELSGFPGYKREGPPAKTRVCGFWRTSSFRAK